MKARIRKWGNGLALRIPKSVVPEMCLEANMPIEISVESGKLIMAAASECPLTLKNSCSK